MLNIQTHQVSRQAVDQTVIIAACLRQLVNDTIPLKRLPY